MHQISFWEHTIAQIICEWPSRHAHMLRFLGTTWFQRPQWCGSLFLCSLYLNRNRIHYQNKRRSPFTFHTLNINENKNNWNLFNFKVIESMTLLTSLLQISRTGYNFGIIHMESWNAAKFIEIKVVWFEVGKDCVNWFK